MNEREREIDTAIRKARRREFFRSLWELRLVVIGGVALLSVLGIGAGFAAAPMKFEGEQLGHVVAEGNVVTTRKGAQYRHDTIQLDNGATITLDLPGPENARKDAPMKIEIYQKDWGPLHHATYRFAGYADAAEHS
ncbi:MAG TPA: hypothetical protein PK080_07175 [Hyphomonadaceae bacterium]|nr:hypothetical protein [Hyphomonadaceae bacterium]